MRKILVFLILLVAVGGCVQGEKSYKDENVTIIEVDAFMDLIEINGHWYYRSNYSNNNDTEGKLVHLPSCPFDCSSNK